MPDERPPPRAIAFRGGGFLPAPRPLHAWLVFPALLALWQATSSLGWISPVFLPSPADIGTALWRLVVTGALWQNLAPSLLRIGLGWLIGAALGLVLGLAMGLSSVSRALGMPLVSALFPIPKIALLPLLILWLGIGEAPKIATIAAGVFFPTVIATFSGVDSAPRTLIRMAQSFDLPVRAIVWKIILPAALPSILAGCRISVSTALLLVVSAEMIGAEFGLGAFLLAQGNLSRPDELMAGVVVVSLLGLGLGALIGLAEKAFLAWR